MKKLLLFVFALTLGLGLRAQCPYTQAMDFTATDVHGTEVHLFDILDGGQAVLIDFFFTTCGPCQQACPKIVEAYTAMGCNMHDVYFIEIDTGDSDAACLNWVNTYGVEYPTISGTGGGTAICNQYGIDYYPTVILIMPDHSIVIQDLYPIPNAQTVISQLEAHGLQQHDCTEPVGELTITPDTLWFSHMGEDLTFTITNVSYPEIVTIEDVIPEEGSALNIWEPSFPLPLDGGQSVDVVVGLQVPPRKDDHASYTIRVLTSVGEKLVVAMVDNTALDMGLMLWPYFVVALDAQNPSLDLFLTNGNSGTQTPIVINAIKEGETVDGPYLNIELTEDLPMTLNTGDEYHFVISPIGTGAKKNVVTTVDIEYEGGTASYSVEIEEGLLNITELHNAMSLCPNPANEFVTLKGEQLGVVRVYNTLGQKVDEFYAEGNELNMNTTQYENGVYIIKANEKTLRFVVKH